jgi:hypothetical protein
MFLILMSLAIMAELVALPAGVEIERPAETHCVLFVVDQLHDGELIMSDPVCFDGEFAAQAWIESGLDQSAQASPGGVTAASTFTLGRHHDGFNGTGSSVRVVGSSCTGGWWNTSTWWDNRISSSYNGCSRLRHWDYPNKAGSFQDTYGSGTTDNLSYMNNRTESVSYHSS